MRSAVDRPAHAMPTRAIAGSLLAAGWFVASAAWWPAWTGRVFFASGLSAALTGIAGALLPLAAGAALLWTLPKEGDVRSRQAACALVPAASFAALLVLVVGPLFDALRALVEPRSPVPAGSFAGLIGAVQALWLALLLIVPQQFLLRRSGAVVRFGFVVLSAGVPVAAMLIAQAPSNGATGTLVAPALALAAIALGVVESVRVLMEGHTGLRAPLVGSPGEANLRPYEQRTDERRIGVALSGGGYRASLFAAGALMVIHEACRTAGPVERRVAAVASVSGGSVTNGLFAHTLRIGLDDVAALDAACRRLIRHATGGGSMFAGTRARAYYAALLPATALLLLALGWAWTQHMTWGTAWRIVALAAVPPLMWATMTLGQALPGLRWSWADAAKDLLFLLGPLVAGPLVVVLALEVPAWRLAMAWIAATGLVLVATAAVWALRGPLIQRTFDALLRDGGPSPGPSPRLAEAHADTHHVFCATEVQFGETAYLAGDQIRCRTFDRVGPGELPTAAAVRASAAFPGAFPPMFIAGVSGKGIGGVRGRESGADFSTGHMSLVDGGVRDNLGIGWFEIAPDLEQLVVVSSAANRHALKSIAGLPGIGELLTLLNIVNIPYNSRERNRRRDLAARLLGKAWSGGRQECAGALVHIEDSPYDLAWKLEAKATGSSQAGTWLDQSPLPPWDVDQWLAVEHLWQSAGADTAVLGERAEAVMKWLDALERRLPEAPLLTTGDVLSLRVATMRSPLGGESSLGGSDAQAAWWMRTRASTLVGTKLSRIAPHEAMNLVLHGYCLAMAQLHIVAGWPLTDTLDEARLAELFDGRLSDPARERQRQSLRDRLRSFEARPLEAHQPVVILWTAQVRIREAGELRTRTAVMAVAATPAGRFEPLALALAPVWQDTGRRPADGPAEVLRETRELTRRFWQDFVGALRRRGLQEVDVVLRELPGEIGDDRLAGMDAAIRAAYPRAFLQPRAAAWVRDVVLWLVGDESKAAAADLRNIMFAADEAQALHRRDAFGAQWNAKRERMHRRLVEHWDDIAGALALSAQARTFLGRIDEELVDLGYKVMRRAGERGAVADASLALAHLLADVEQSWRRRRAAKDWAKPIAAITREVAGPRHASAVGESEQRVPGDR